MESVHQRGACLLAEAEVVFVPLEQLGQSHLVDSLRIHHEIGLTKITFMAYLLHTQAILRCVCSQILHSRLAPEKNYEIFLHYD